MRTPTLVLLAPLAVFAAACSSGPSNPLAPTMTATASTSTAAHAGHETYDASGIWFGLFFVDGQQIGEGFHRFTQDASGNLIAVGTEDPDDPEFDRSTYTFSRINGRFAPVGKYRLTIFAPAADDESCARDLSGRATLNSKTNAIEAEVTGTIDNCATVTVQVRWQKQ